MTVPVAGPIQNGGNSLRMILLRHLPWTDRLGLPQETVRFTDVCNLSRRNIPKPLSKMRWAISVDQGSNAGNQALLLNMRSQLSSFWFCAISIIGYVSTTSCASEIQIAFALYIQRIAALLAHRRISHVADCAFHIHPALCIL